MFMQWDPALLFELMERVLSKTIFYSLKSVVKAGHLMKATLRTPESRKLPIIPKLCFCGF